MTSSNPFEGEEVPPDAEDWIRANPHEAAEYWRTSSGRTTLRPMNPSRLQSLEWAHEGDVKFPKPILGCAKDGGSNTLEGEICVLSAAGGAGKSTLAVSIALSVAAAEDNAHEPMELKGALFHGFRGMRGVRHVRRPTVSDQVEASETWRAQWN